MLRFISELVAWTKISLTHLYLQDVFEVFSKHPFMGTSELIGPRITLYLTPTLDITVEYARPLRKAKTDGDSLTGNKNRWAVLLPHVLFTAKYCLVDMVLSVPNPGILLQSPIYPAVLAGRWPSLYQQDFCWISHEAFRNWKISDVRREASSPFVTFKSPRTEQGKLIKSDSTDQLNSLVYPHSFIEYTSRSDAHLAVRKLSGEKLHGNVVTLATREVRPLVSFVHPTF